jgi:hypothetical protein
MTAKVDLAPTIPNALAAGNTVNAVVTIRDNSRYKEGRQHYSTLLKSGSWQTGLEALSFYKRSVKAAMDLSLCSG